MQHIGNSLPFYKINKDYIQKQVSKILVEKKQEYKKHGKQSILEKYYNVNISLRANNRYKSPTNLTVDVAFIKINHETVDSEGLFVHDVAQF
jgi:hypothetical protein